MPSVSNPSLIAVQAYASQVARQRDDAQGRVPFQVSQDAVGGEARPRRALPVDQVDVGRALDSSVALDHVAGADTPAPSSGENREARFLREAPRAEERARILRPGSTLDISV